MTIFETTSIDRNICKWEDYMYSYTPVEQIGNMYFKREDKFAPLGFNSVNGSKLRQCLWLVDRWAKQGVKGIISGSVVGSPQHPFISSICKHYGLDCIIVTGSKNYLQHKNMQLAHQMGAKFHVTNIGYAKALQSICFKMKQSMPDYEVLETNITLDEKLNTPESIEGFHSIGGHQVGNLPDNIETIIIPCGSCNSVVSILYGLSIKKPKNLKNIVLIGIGNNGSNNLKYIPNRLATIGGVIGKDINSTFNFSFIDGFASDGVDVVHFNPNAEGFCKYADLMPYEYNGLKLHPRYEGKCFFYMYKNKQKFLEYRHPNTLFWVVGNEPTFIP